ncbi:ApeI family dehydratase [Gilvimarinus agarilyticus]|uniref:ApeI family dehydratase n=1 Tax=Gilvimarinus agarilyticus TaxID=679259 RepID=UPI00069798E9|nr:hypothetical protein [Gilvimarinus agarilyticus]
MQLPQPVTSSQSEQEFCVSLELQPQDPCFAGHFEGLPVLAGVVQVGWVFGFAEQFLGRRFEFLGLASNKFLQLVRPPVKLQLTVQYQRDQGRLKFVYRMPGGVCSRGAICVRELT